MKKIITLLSIIILSGCSSDETDNNPLANLPAVTQTGANTFGCLINGKLFVPRDGNGTIQGSDDGLSKYGGYPEITDYTEIEAIDYKSERTAKVFLHIQNVHELGIGEFQIDASNGMESIDGNNHNYLHCRVFNESTNSYQYYRSYENSGKINVTRYDFANGIISGTFSCSLQNSSNLQDVIEIENGRFDINGYTLPNVIFP